MKISIEIFHLYFWFEIWQIWNQLNCFFSLIAFLPINSWFAVKISVRVALITSVDCFQTLGFWLNSKSWMLPFQLLKHDPTKRLPLLEVINHPWVQSNLLTPPVPGSLAAMGKTSLPPASTEWDFACCME